MDATKTGTHPSVPQPDLFVPHPGLSDQVNRNIVQSEILGGVHLSDLEQGAVLEVETQNHWYTLINRGHGQVLICGHPQYCPYLVPVRIDGSTWGGSMLKVGFIGRGMRLEFQHPTYRTIVTSCIVNIRTAESLSH